MLPTPQAGRQTNLLLARYGTALGRIIDRGQAELAVAQTAKLQRIDALMGAIVEQSFDGILSFGEDGRVVTANPSAAKIFGTTPDALRGQRFKQLFPDLEGFRSYGEIAGSQAGGRLEGGARRLDGSHFPVELSVRVAEVLGERLIVVVVRDITWAKAQENRLRHQAMHDALTSLPNRVLLHDRLQQALHVAKRAGEPLALLLLDLDRFKEVNDTLGHQVGDLLLGRISRRIGQCLRRSDTVARLGGDEFAILLPPPSDQDRALEVAERVLRAVEEPIEVMADLRLEVGISIGIALFPRHARAEAKLMQCADVAMYAAKRGGLKIQTYDPHKDHNTIRHLTVSGALRQAIDGGELSFAYQPQLDLKNRTVCSAEALVRWQHPTHGLIPPAEFVPQAERTGMIGGLTNWTFDAALRQLARWRELGQELGVAVNLSPRSLHEEALPGMVASLLERWQVDPARVTIELTESAVMLDPAGARRILDALHNLGVRLSIDDFGTGYSSLSHLQRLPLDELKIDKSFVVNMTENEPDLVIVRSTIELAHNLGLAVVAEGLEIEAHLEILTELGCDLGQGFLIGKPCLAEQLSEEFGRGPWQTRPAA
jgi:diguanylate cyclase (GGDEF)-like protein/PAS domain S-box-containing protein